MRETKLIASGVAQANTGQTTVVETPDWAKFATYYLNITAVGGTTCLTDYAIQHAVPKITGAAVVATTSAGGADEDEVQTTELSGMVDATDTVNLTWNGVESTTTIDGDMNEAARIVAAQAAIDECADTFSGYTAGDIVVTAGVDADHQVFTFSGTSVSNRDVSAITVTSGAGGASGTVAETNKGVGHERQTITLTGGPTHGTWRIAWGGVSANVAVTTPAIPAAATAAQVAEALAAALYASGGSYNLSTAYDGRDIEVTRTGSGTSGAPYVYTLVFSGTSVANTNVDAVTVTGTDLRTYAADSAHGIGNAWNGVTQIVDTTAASVRVRVGPGITGAAEDDTGAVYTIDDMLSERLAHVLTFSRADGNETYTYSLTAVYAS